MTEAVRLSEAQRRVLAFVVEYGDMIDFGGRGACRNNLNAAKQLIHLGLLSGSYRAACVTPAGRAALNETEARLHLATEQSSTPIGKGK